MVTFGKTNKIKYQSIFKFNEVKKEVLDNTYTFPNILEYNLNINNSILFPEALTNSKVIGFSGYQYKFNVVKNDTEKDI